MVTSGNRGAILEIPKTNISRHNWKEVRMKLTGSEIVIECLKEQGVDTVFGYPGGAILNIYDELYKHDRGDPSCPHLP